MSSFLFNLFSGITLPLSLPGTLYAQAECDPEVTAGIYFAQGNAAYAVEDYVQALADYTCAVEISPEYVTAYYERGRVHYELRNYEQAIADYTKAIELGLHSTDIYV